MKAHFKSRTGRIVVEVEGASVKALFKEIAQVQEILDADSQCGACGSADIKFRVRTVAENDYYELVCDGCGAALSFGQRRTGDGLYPKRKTESGPVPDRGWVKYLGRGPE
jgi:hypothetical protein